MAQLLGDWWQRTTESALSSSLLTAQSERKLPSSKASQTATHPPLVSYTLSLSLSGTLNPPQKTFLEESVEAVSIQTYSAPVGIRKFSLSTLYLSAVKLSQVPHLSYILLSR